MFTKQEFLDSKQGSKYSDVERDSGITLSRLVDFLQDPNRQDRLVSAEMHFDLPALAGVVRELEQQEWFHGYMMDGNSDHTYRLRQATGVLVKMVMLEKGFQTTGKKGMLGQRSKTSTSNSTKQTPHNRSGISLWFKCSERYVPRDGTRWLTVAERASDIERLVTLED